MDLDLLHRRLVVAMSLFGLVAYAGGTGFSFLSGLIALALLTIALFWRPSEQLGAWIERLWLPLAVLLVGRALFHALVLQDDVVLPVVDLLLLLLCAEAFRSVDAPNDARLYALSFALLLAATAYRPGVLFGFAFVGYTIVGTAALMVGHLRREGRRHGPRPISVGSRFLPSTLAVSGFTVAFATLVFVAFPRVSRDWSGRTPLPRTAMAGFADQVSLGEHGSSIYANPQVILRVEFPDGPPSDPSRLYWRGRSYDRFDGVRWARSSRLPPSSVPSDWYRDRWPSDTVRTEIYAARLESRALFGLHPLLTVRARSPIHPIFDNAGDHSYWGSARPAYVATSVARRPPVDQLRAASGRFAPSRRYFLQLPRVSERITALADSLVAGLDNRYDRVARVRDWFSRGFTYTLELPATAGEATLDSFLFDRRAGHCEYFSTAMVVLLRSVGIQAREVNGFLGGEWNEFGGYLAVTQNQAHSWVEVWFPGFGWVGFDPTPAGVGGGGTVRSWTWPGLFFLDGVRHRWTKWVLDFDTESQADLLVRLRTALDPAPTVTLRGEDAGSSWGLAAALAAIVTILGTLLLVVLRSRGAPLGRESRHFAELRRTYASAGLASASALGPARLLEEIERGKLPGLPEARDFVAVYLRARFSRRGSSDREIEGLKRKLAEIRRLVRRG
jgi:transglutaminase-like putative cysteine protease